MGAAGLALVVAAAFFALNMHVLNPDAFRARARGESTGSNIADGQIDVARRWPWILGVGVLMIVLDLLV